MSGRKEHTKTESGCMKPEAEIGVTWPQARGMSGATRSWNWLGKGSALELLEEKLTP